MLEWHWLVCPSPQRGRAQNSWFCSAACRAGESADRTCFAREGGRGGAVCCCYRYAYTHLPWPRAKCNLSLISTHLHHRSARETGPHRQAQHRDREVAMRSALGPRCVYAALRSALTADPGARRVEQCWCRQSSNCRARTSVGDIIFAMRSRCTHAGGCRTP